MLPHLHDYHAHDHPRIITIRQQSGEGNVFSRVCPQGWEGGSHVTTTPRKCSKLFNLHVIVHDSPWPRTLSQPTPSVKGPSLIMFKLVHYVACTVVKWGRGGVGILLEL